MRGVYHNICVHIVSLGFEMISSLNLLYGMHASKNAYSKYYKTNLFLYFFSLFLFRPDLFLFSPLEKVKKHAPPLVHQFINSELIVNHRSEACIIDSYFLNIHT